VTAIQIYDDTTLHALDRGDGQPMLLLHGGGGPSSVRDVVECMSASARVIAPTHPGFAGTPRPEWLDSIDDLAYLYLDLLQRDDLRDVTVVGFSLGGWIAAEMAVRDCSRIGRLVLVDAVGIRVGGREDRDIADVFALHRDEVRRLMFHDPSLATRLEAMNPVAIDAIAYNEEAMVLYGWEPYMHNPKLRRRLARIQAPALVVWGVSDGIVTPEYGRAYAQSIPAASFELIDAAGHAPQLEQPERLSELIIEFAAGPAVPVASL
jgi:pimeloyl-ACP methyl ester carboxylesterase